MRRVALTAAALLGRCWLGTWTTAFSAGWTEELVGDLQSDSTLPRGIDAATVAPMSDIDPSLKRQHEFLAPVHHYP